MERQFTRLDDARKLIDPIINGIENEKSRRGAFVHLYGVGLLAAVLALKRGFSRETAELAEITGMLHDLLTYVDPKEDTDDHAHKCAEYAKEHVLSRMECLTEDEKRMMYLGIFNHSDKHRKDSDFEELIKDADAAHHSLRNPMEDRFFNDARIQQVLRELV